MSVRFSARDKSPNSINASHQCRTFFRLQATSSPRAVRCRVTSVLRYVYIRNDPSHSRMNAQRGECQGAFIPRHVELRDGISIRADRSIYQTHSQRRRGCARRFLWCAREKRESLRAHRGRSVKSESGIFFGRRTKRKRRSRDATLSGGKSRLLGSSKRFLKPGRGENVSSARDARNNDAGKHSDIQAHPWRARETNNEEDPTIDAYLRAA